MSVIGFCKTWRGTDFLIPAIRALYRHVDKIVFLHSDVSWSGQKGNTVAPCVLRWKLSHDYQKKIINERFDSTDQVAQYKRGLEFIKSEFDPDYIFLFDTDEVWDRENLKRLFAQALQYNCYRAFCVNMHTYIKSPLYRVTPEEPCHPICLIDRECVDIFDGIRGVQIPRPDRATFNNVHMHHFTYVRRNESAIFEKIENIYTTEKDSYGHVNLEEWKREKWDKLPNAEDLHTAQGFQANWKGVRVIDKSELPFAVRTDPDIISQWRLYE